jgi:periplasmic protein TonB
MADRVFELIIQSGERGKRPREDPEAVRAKATKATKAEKAGAVPSRAPASAPAATGRAVKAGPSAASAPLARATPAASAARAASVPAPAAAEAGPAASGPAASKGASLPAAAVTDPAPAPAPASAAPLRQTTLELMASMQPAFPGRLLRSLGKGSVQVEFEVRPDGSVSRATVLRSPDPGLNAAALAAVRAWRFKPVSELVTGTVELRFESE